MIEEVQEVLPLFEGIAEPIRNSAATERWLSELGQASEHLGHMMRKPTESRPFVYEARFDLMPVKGDGFLLVLKGFGADGGLCAFHNDISFVGLLRGASAQMKAGKLKWYPDQYEPSNYSARTERFLSGDFYKV